MKMNIGKFFIGSFELNENWEVDELYENILKLKDKDAITPPEEGGPKLKNYKYFYLKIFGPYNEKITNNFRKCECCPNNPSYYRFMDYNELLNKKQKVLVIKSKYFDFREYEIYSSYYSDEKLLDNINDSYIEIRADKKSIYDKTFELILRLIKKITFF